MSTRRPLYWLLTGALIGFGVIAILSIGLPFIVLGLILLGVGFIRLGGAGLWAALVGFGGVPALILLWDVTSMPWACEPQSGVSTQTGVNYFTCVDTFLGPLTTYYVMAFGFGIIALLGLAWPLLRRLWGQPHRPEAKV